MGLIYNLLFPPKTFLFNEYETVDELNISQKVYDKILSIVDASLSKPRCSQGVVIVRKINECFVDKYLAQDIIHFRYVYDNLFSNDDLKQVIDYIKPDRGSRIGFIYHIIEDTHEDLGSQLLDLRGDTMGLVEPKRQNNKRDHLIPYDPILNSAGDCGHIWIEKKEDGKLKFYAFLPVDEVPVLRVRKRVTGAPVKKKNHVDGIRYVRYLNIDCPDEHFSNKSISDLLT